MFREVEKRRGKKRADLPVVGGGLVWGSCLGRERVDVAANEP